jgi:hypothetical protein
MNVVVDYWLHLRCKLVSFTDLVLDASITIPNLGPQATRVHNN